MDFPIWQYLKQPVFSATYKTILNPGRFWRSHQISHLKNAGTRLTVQKKIFTENLQKFSASFLLVKPLTKPSR
ncbi:MAG: hypothetical protein HC816_18610 [Leptolyngbyaceae cyanobacterium RM1_1_2]|nr:hypothetical protein [Leptolyngbyaceae cyanobacterium RM1_1_2]